MLELIMKELSALGCEARVDSQGRLMISNARRIDSVLAESIKEHRELIIELVSREPEPEFDEMDPVRCGSCGGDCDVFVLPEWLCSNCDKGCQNRREASSQWRKHRRRILKTEEANRG